MVTIDCLGHNKFNWEVLECVCECVCEWVNERHELYRALDKGAI